MIGLLRSRGKRRRGATWNGSASTWVGTCSSLGWHVAMGWDVRLARAILFHSSSSIHLSPLLTLRRSSLVLAPSVASSSSSSTHAHVSLRSCPTSSFERRNSPRFWVGKAEGTTGSFGFDPGSHRGSWWVRTRTTVRSNRGDGGRRHRTTTKRRKRTRHVRETSVDVDRNVRNQG